ncbi:hypothetical protein [Shouchella patagoniensis]|nr:hypothetical protein [Shouchella patagoniensis]
MKQRTKTKRRKKRNLWEDVLKKRIGNWKKRRENQNPYPQSRRSIA